MLHQVTPSLYFGDLDSAHRAMIPDAVMVHACKEPCHRNAVGYAGKITAAHPQYLHREDNDHLYLNMIDPPHPLFQADSFALFFAFVDKHITTRPVIIHCNQGMSRAPSLVLLYMAKRLGLLPDTDYATARHAFEKKFPYSPGAGIALFLSDTWSSLG